MSAGAGASAAVEPFSIRGYAARMRVVDAAKCWLFGGAEEEAAPLPPMAPPPRCRWWAHELVAERARLEVGAKVGAVAGSGDGGGAMEKKRKRKGSCVVERAKKRRRMLQLRIFLKHKEKTYKPQAKSHLLQRLLHMRLLRKCSNSTIHARRRKQAVRKKLSGTKDYIPDNSLRKQNSVGIDSLFDVPLRRKEANSFPNKRRVIRSVSSLLSPSCEVVKHVTFPANDDIFGDLPLLESSKIMFQNEADEQLPIAMDDSFVANRTGLDVMQETVPLKFVPTSGIRDHMSSPVEEITSKGTSDKESTCIPDNSATTNLHDHPSSVGLDGALNCRSTDMVKRCFGDMQLKSIDISALSSCSEEKPKSCSSNPAQKFSRVAINYCQEIIKPAISISATSSAALKTRNGETRKDRDSLVNGRKGTEISSPVVPTEYHLLAKGLHIRSHGIANLGPNTDSMPSCKNMPTNEYFHSFRPNSQERIVKTHSDDIGYRDVSLHTPSRFSNFESSRGHDSAKNMDPCASLLMEDQSIWYSKLRPVCTPASFGLAFMKLPGLERMEISGCNLRTNRDRSVNCGEAVNLVSTTFRCQKEQVASSVDMLDQTKVDIHKKRSLDAYMRQDAHHLHQPTVHFMGNTASVCKRSKEHRGMTMGKVWTDRKIITEERHPSSISGQLPQKNLVSCQDSEASRGHGVQSLDVLLRIPNSAASEARVNNSDLHRQRVRPTKSVSSSVNSCILNNGSQFLPRAELNKPSMVGWFLPRAELNKPSTVSQFLPRAELNKPSTLTAHSKTRSSELRQLPPTLTIPLNQGSPLCTSASHMCTEANTFVGSAVNQSSRFPHWMLNASMQERFQKSTLPSYGDTNLVPIREPCPVSGKFSSTSMISFVDYTINNAQPRNSSPALHPSLVPTSLASKSIPTISPTCTGSLTNMDDRKHMFIKGSDCADLGNKRLADADNVLLRYAKKPLFTDKHAAMMPAVSNIRNHLDGWWLNDAVGPKMLDFNNRIAEISTQVAINENSSVRVNSGSAPVAETIRAL